MGFEGMAAPEDVPRNGAVRRRTAPAMRPDPAAMRFTDGASGRSAPVRAPVGALLRIDARLGPSPGTALRTLVVADVLARTVELMGWQAVLVADRAAADHRDRAAACGVRPAADPAGTTGPPAAVVAAADAASEPPSTAPVVTAGAVDDRAADRRPPPLALRLALLRAPHGAPVAVSAESLAEADRELERWRGQVARWAEGPPEAVPDRLGAAVAGALTRGADTASLLQLLDSVARDDAVPPRAAFEVFGYADRVLALELVRDIGRR